MNRPADHAFNQNGIRFCIELSCARQWRDQRRHNASERQIKFGPSFSQMTHKPWPRPKLPYTIYFCRQLVY